MYIYLLDAIYCYVVIGLMHTKEGALVIHILSIVILTTGTYWCLQIMALLFKSSDGLLWIGKGQHPNSRTRLKDVVYCMCSTMHHLWSQALSSGKAYVNLPFSFSQTHRWTSGCLTTYMKSSVLNIQFNVALWVFTQFN